MTKYEKTVTHVSWRICGGELFVAATEPHTLYLGDDMVPASCMTMTTTAMNKAGPDNVCDDDDDDDERCAENAGPENGGPIISECQKVENAGLENAGPTNCAENAAIMAVISERNVLC